MQCCLQTCKFPTDDLLSERVFCKCSHDGCQECEMHVECFNALNVIAMRYAFPTGRRKHASVASHQHTPAMLWSGRFLDMIRSADHRCRCGKGITTPATNCTDVLYIRPNQGQLMLEDAYIRPNGAVCIHQPVDAVISPPPNRKTKQKNKITTKRSVYSPNIDRATRNQYEFKSPSKVILPTPIDVSSVPFELVNDQFPTLDVQSPLPIASSPFEFVDDQFPTVDARSSLPIALVGDHSSAIDIFAPLSTQPPPSTDSFSMYSNSNVFSDKIVPLCSPSSTVVQHKVEPIVSVQISLCVDVLLCPITMEIFKDPVMIIETGDTYEREAIELWRRNDTSDPLTGLDLPVCTLVFNRLIYSMSKNATFPDSTESIESSSRKAGRGGRGGRGGIHTQRRGRGGRGYANE